jgi:BirA family biotin operon repressor/biotin-[acetyl-CoA-carboxylase] ligase
MLSTRAIETALGTERLGRPVHYFRKLHSTNEEAKLLALRGANDGTLVIADEQTAGRGRLGRHWWAPPGDCLLMSLLFRPELSPAQAQRLTMIAGLSCAEAVEKETGLRPDLKWPNDLLLSGRKLAGILTELQVSGGSLEFVVVGIGLNVNVDFRQQPDLHLRSSATGLSQAVGREVDRLSLLNRCLMIMESRYNALRSGHSPHEEWSQRLVTLGKTVRVDSHLDAAEVMDRGQSRIGQAIGVDPNGALLLQTDDGRVERVLAGDVTVVESN